MPKETKPTFQGKCFLCQQIFPKAGMTKHLTSCRKAAYEKEMAKAKEQTVFQIVIEARDPRYWLHVDVPGKAKLEDLDGFLRGIWLECCGHMSMFTIDGRQYSGSSEALWELERNEGELSMRVAVEKVLRPKTKIHYEYDFGSTTELMLRVVSEQNIQFKGKEIRLLARNEEPEILCGKCEKARATQACCQCSDEAEGWLCAKCARKHSCGEEMLLPVVNSPRTGICGYCG